MAKILVLHEDASIRTRLATILRTAGHRMVGCASIEEAQKEDLQSIDLCICSQMGKYSDGLIFALEVIHEGKKALILSERKKFSRIPLLTMHDLCNIRETIYKVELALTGG